MLLSLKTQCSLSLVNRTPVRTRSTSHTESDGVSNHVSFNKHFIANPHRCFECAQLLTSNPPSVTFGVLVKNRKKYINPVLVLRHFALSPLRDLRPYLISAPFFKLTSFGWLRHTMLNTYIWWEYHIWFISLESNLSVKQGLWVAALFIYGNGTDKDKVQNKWKL
jgi:hypothetical protein